MGARKIYRTVEQTLAMVKSLEGFTASLLLKLVEFQPDPRASEKKAQREENSEKWSSPLDPHPRFNDWEYHKLLTEGVRPLAASRPYETARVLVDAAASMVRLRVYEAKDDQERNDLSEIWCRRVREPSRRFLTPEEDLIHTLTYACERVYANSPESIVGLNEALRNQPWTLFKRIREHLYALHPNDQTKPWIRELIINHKDYSEWEHRFEFQQMIRSACKRFGATLLTERERTTIFDAILSGPSKSHYREWLGEQYTEEAFQRRQRFFHVKQLKPFAAVLFGKYADYFRELEAEHTESVITDDDYSPIGEVRGGTVSHRSPKSKEELAAFKDTELLKFINDWQDTSRSAEDWLVEITIGALAREFGSIFRGSIATDESRLAFWMQNLRHIQRPVYVRAIIEAAQETVKSRAFDKLPLWFDVCEWILSHPDAEPEEGSRGGDESRENPDWHSSRRAVGDFVETCVQKEVSVPIEARERIAVLLDKLCTEFDWRLDADRPVLLNRDDQLTEAINNTRSRALESLLDFGYWVRRESGDTKAAVPEVGGTLEKRLTSESDHPLTLSEYAILGTQFTRIWDLDGDWATKHKSSLFPRRDFRAWLEAFSNFLRYSRPFRPMFDLFREDIEFALENLQRVDSTNSLYSQLTDTLGEHLFTYYLWDVYPLTGDKSLLERFYLSTGSDRVHWASLFDYVGRSLKNTGPNLADNLKQRITAFFDWRLAQREATELKEFTFWLEAEALAPEWRLSAFSRILDITHPDFALSLHIKALVEMLNEHTALVLECFAKLTDHVDNGESFYIQLDHAKAILKVGLQSEDPTTRSNAQRARENLLRADRFDLLEISE
jgi:hypothetical protein